MTCPHTRIQFWTNMCIPNILIFKFRNINAWARTCAHSRTRVYVTYIVSLTYTQEVCYVDARLNKLRNTSFSLLESY